MSRHVSIFVAGLAMLAAALPATAENIYCTVVGAKQGTFQNDRGLNGNLKQIPVLALTEEVKVPYDAASGLASGKQTHSPLIIVKTLDSSSPQFFEAAATNESIRSVTCTLYRVSAEGVARAYFKIALTNASIIEVKDTGNGANGDAAGDERERISFTYQRIELSDLDTGTTATDDWIPTT